MRAQHLILLTLALLIGCRSIDEAPAPTATTEENTAVPPTTTIEEAASPTATVPAPSPTPVATEDVAVDAEEMTAPAASLPFAGAWEDPAPYRTGLVPAAQEALDLLDTAPVYHMQLDVDADLAHVRGHQAVRVVNTEDVPLETLYFHLYPNLLGGQLTVTELAAEGTAVTPEYENEETVMAVPLPQPLEPGAETAMTIDFETAVPRELERNYGVLASAEGVLALAHFYPTLAVYDANGWDLEARAPQGDVTYADAAFYLVEVTAPEEVTIAGSGIVLAETETATTQTQQLAAGPARDFYLALSPDYTRISETRDGVTINSYAPAAVQTGNEMALDVTRRALESYAAQFGPYPYTELDLVSTPTLALGIEYPGIIANTVRIYDLEAENAQIYLESTTVHEVAHQWFYNLVGNDQVDEPWLDEAVTQYATWTYYRDRYGTAGANGFYQSFQNRWGRVEMAEIPIGMPVAAYEGPEYGAIVYGRGPIFVRQLAEEMGQETFDAFLRDYVETYRWRIAAAADFQALAEEHCDCDLSDLFAEWVYGES